MRGQPIWQAHHACAKTFHFWVGNPLVDWSTSVSKFLLIQRVESMARIAAALYLGARLSPFVIRVEFAWHPIRDSTTVGDGSSIGKRCTSRPALTCAMTQVVQLDFLLATHRPGKRLQTPLCPWPIGRWPRDFKDWTKTGTENAG